MGKPIFAAAARPVRDHAADAIGPRQELPGQIDVARGNRLAHAAAGDDLADDRDRLDDFERNVGLLAKPGQHFDVSGPAAAEEKFGPSTIPRASSCWRTIWSKNSSGESCSRASSVG